MARIMHGRCPTCGRMSQLNWHTLSKSLVLTLAEFMAHNDRNGRNLTAAFHLADVPIDYYRRTNAQKLQYWGLVEIVRSTKRAKSGIWRVTPLGVAFMYARSEGRVPHQVSTYDGNIRGRSRMYISCVDVPWGYATYSEFKTSNGV